MAETTGPLAILYKYVQQEIRIKIYTRKEKGIRGITTGIIIAFDKYWNVLLKDVHETWRRRKFLFSESNASFGKPMNNPNYFDQLGIEIPKINVKSLNRKYVECTRQITAAMIRGEQIVLITEDKDNLVTRKTDESKECRKEISN